MLQAPSDFGHLQLPSSTNAVLVLVWCWPRLTWPVSLNKWFNHLNVKKRYKVQLVPLVFNNSKRTTETNLASNPAQVHHPRNLPAIFLTALPVKPSSLLKSSQQSTVTSSTFLYGNANASLSAAANNPSSPYMQPLPVKPSSTLKSSLQSTKTSSPFLNGNANASLSAAVNNPSSAIVQALPDKPSASSVSIKYWLLPSNESGCAPRSTVTLSTLASNVSSANKLALPVKPSSTLMSSLQSSESSTAVKDADYLPIASSANCNKVLILRKVPNTVTEPAESSADVMGKGNQEKEGTIAGPVGADVMAKGNKKKEETIAGPVGADVMAKGNKKKEETIAGPVVSKSGRAVKPKLRYSP